MVHAQGTPTLVAELEARPGLASSKAVAKHQAASPKARMRAEQRRERRPAATGPATPAQMVSTQGHLDGVGVRAFLLEVGSV